MRKNSIKNVQRAATFAAFIFVFATFGALTTANAQATIANYDFATAVAGTTTVTPLATASNVTSTGTTSVPITVPAGTATGASAFTPNAINQSISLAGSTAPRVFTFQLSGSSLDAYQNYRVYFQTQRSNTGSTTATLSYSTDGTAFINFQDITIPTAFGEFLIDLSSVTALNRQANVTFRLTTNAPTAATGTNRIDNFQVQASTPTAATVEVGGRVVDVRGRGITKARVTVTDNAGVSRSVVTNAFGDFGFDGVEVGETYVYSVSAKGYQFSQPSQALTVNDNYSGITFNAISSGFPTTRK